MTSNEKKLFEIGFTVVHKLPYQWLYRKDSARIEGTHFVMIIEAPGGLVDATSYKGEDNSPVGLTKYMMELFSNEIEEFLAQSR